GVVNVAPVTAVPPSGTVYQLIVLPFGAVAFKTAGAPIQVKNTPSAFNPLTIGNSGKRLTSYIRKSFNTPATPPILISMRSNEPATGTINSYMSVAPGNNRSA